MTLPDFNSKDARYLERAFVCLGFPSRYELAVVGLDGHSFHAKYIAPAAVGPVFDAMVVLERFYSDFPTMLHFVCGRSHRYKKARFN